MFQATPCVDRFALVTEREPILPKTRAMLVRFFPGWRGEASEPAFPSPIINRPAPVAAHALVLA